MIDFSGDLTVLYYRARRFRFCYFVFLWVAEVHFDTLFAFACTSNGDVSFIVKFMVTIVRDSDNFLSLLEQ